MVVVGLVTHNLTTVQRKHSGPHKDKRLLQLQILQLLLTHQPGELLKLPEASSSPKDARVIGTTLSMKVESRTNKPGEYSQCASACCGFKSGKCAGPGE